MLVLAVVDDSSHNKIVLDANDPDSNGGYVTFVEAMLDEAMALGVRFYPLHELVKLTEPVSPVALAKRDWSRGLWQPRFELTFANGATALSAVYVANHMQQPLLQVLQKSSLSFMQPSDLADPDEARTDSVSALYLPRPDIACKWYVYYDRAWWREPGFLDQHGRQLYVPALDITRGAEPSGSYRQDAPNDMSMPIVGRYHDGHSRCRADGSCYGFLMVVYTSARSTSNQCAFFEEYELSYDPPVTTFTNEDSIGDYLLKHTHKRVMDYHRQQNVTLDQSIIDTPPSMGVLSLWGTHAKGFGGGWNGFRAGGESDPLDTNCRHPPCTNHVYQHPTPQQAPMLASQPWPGVPFYVCNEAFGRNHGWAEGSLEMAEYVLSVKMGLRKPAWVNQDDYDDVIQSVVFTEDQRTGAGLQQGGGR